MKPKSKPAPRRRIQNPTNLVVRKAFSDPIPLQDQLARRFGPRDPIPANKQVPGRNQ